MSLHRRLFACVLICGTAISCSDSTEPRPGAGLFVRVPADSAILGRSVRLTAVATGDDSARVAWPKFSWFSSDTNVMVVDSNGVALAVGVGTATIGAEFDGFRDSVNVGVVLERSDAGAQIASLAGGFAQNCALTLSGTAMCRPAVTGTANATYAPLPGAASIVLTSLHTSATHTCGLTAAGAMYCWGSNAQGQFMTGTLTPATAETPFAAGGMRRFESISVGSALQGSTMRGATCGIDRDDGLVYCAGLNSGLQLGREPALTIDSTVTTMTTALDAQSVTIAGGTYACATTPQDVFCWGQAISSGVASIGGSSATPRNVTEGTPLTKLSVSTTHACGIAASKRVYCWGANNAGQLGIGSIQGSPHFTAEPVQSAESFIALTAGTGFTCGITEDGSLYCWGNFPPTAISSRLGSGRATPVRLVSAGGFTALSTDGTRVCALAAGAKAYCF